MQDPVWGRSSRAFWVVTQFLKPWSRGVPGTFGKMVGLGWSSAENLRPSNRAQLPGRLYVGGHPAPKAPEGGAGRGQSHVAREAGRGACCGPACADRWCQLVGTRDPRKACTVRCTCVVLCGFILASCHPSPVWNYSKELPVLWGKVMGGVGPRLWRRGFTSQKELFPITCSPSEGCKCASDFKICPPNLASDGAKKF